MTADMTRDLADALRDLLANTVKQRDAHSKAHAETLKARSDQREITATGAAVDALDGVLDSEPAIRARRILTRYEWEAPR